MQNVARHTSALVRKQEQLGHTMFEFGVAFTLLANVSTQKEMFFLLCFRNRLLEGCRCVHCKDNRANCP